MPVGSTARGISMVTASAQPVDFVDIRQLTGNWTWNENSWPLPASRLNWRESMTVCLGFSTRTAVVVVPVDLVSVQNSLSSSLMESPACSYSGVLMETLPLI